MTVLGRVEGVELGETALFIKPKDVAPRVIFDKVLSGYQRGGVLCHEVLDQISKEKEEMPPFTVTSPQSLGGRFNYPSMKQIEDYHAIHSRIAHQLIGKLPQLSFKSNQKSGMFFPLYQYCSRRLKESLC
jgi:hypothetical protein